MGRACIAVIIGLTILMTSVPAIAEEPVRSGTIIGGYNLATVNPSPRCSTTPDCEQWLDNRCDPELAGRDPALFTSNVDVRRLAGTKRRIEVFDVVPPYGGGLGSSYEFWTARCTSAGALGEVPRSGKRLIVPRAAKWMTVTSSGLAYKWLMYLGLLGLAEG